MFRIIFCMLSWSVINTLCMEQSYQQQDLQVQVNNIMSRLYEVTATQELETDYELRRVITNQLQNDPNKIYELLQNNQPTTSLVAQLFTMRENAINNMPDEVKKYITFLKKSSVGCTGISCLFLGVIGLCTLWACA